VGLAAENNRRLDARPHRLGPALHGHLQVQEEAVWKGNWAKTGTNEKVEKETSGISSFCNFDNKFKFLISYLHFHLLWHSSVQASQKYCIVFIAKDIQVNLLRIISQSYF